MSPSTFFIASSLRSISIIFCLSSKSPLNLFMLHTMNHTIPTPMSSDAMHHAAQVTRELPHLHLADDGLLYRVAPADSSKPLDTNKYRLYVPHDMRELFTYAYHDRMGHPGQAKTLK